MTGEARAQLEKVLEISPDHGPARAMLIKIDQSESMPCRARETKVDPAVQTDGGEDVTEDRPAP